MKRNLVCFRRIFFIACLIISVYFVINQSQKYLLDHSENSTVKRSCRPWFQWSDYYRKCLVNYLQAKGDYLIAWLQIHEAVFTCSGQTILNMVNVKYLSNKDDVKLIILPSRNLQNLPCTEVTLGVGNDTESEEKLLKLLPHCEMHGADPFVQVGKLFENVGKYYEIAVGSKTGIFNASILVGPGIWDYATKAVPTVAFVDFVKTNIKSNKIDYLFMDNEGAEYEILPLLNRGSVVQLNDIIVCQISVELHGPLYSYNMNDRKYNELMLNITKLTHFIPIWSVPYGRHARMFLLNADNEYCVEKYLYQWCVKQ